MSSYYHEIDAQIEFMLKFGRDAEYIHTWLNVEAPVPMWYVQRRMEKLSNPPNRTPESLLPLVHELIKHCQGFALSLATELLSELEYQAAIAPGAKIAPGAGSENEADLGLDEVRASAQRAADEVAGWPDWKKKL